jgi:dipeptidyl aminopeptidase/acylaminoacyl peptidase
MVFLWPGIKIMPKNKRIIVGIGLASLTVMLCYVSVCVSNFKYIVPTGYSFDIDAEGKKVVWTDEHGKLYLEDIGSKARLQLETGFSENAFPALAPNGQIIIFSAKSDLFSYNLSTHRVNRLTDDTLYCEFFPRFSNDGEYLVFVRAKNNPFSPTGVFYTNYGIWTLRLQDGHLERITTNDYIDVSHPQFCRGDRSILFSAQRDIGDSSKIFMIERNDGARPTELVIVNEITESFGPADPTMPVTGNEIAIVVGFKPSYNYDLWIGTYTESGIVPTKRLTANLHCRQPLFTKSGKKLFFLSLDEHQGNADLLYFDRVTQTSERVIEF